MYRFLSRGVPLNHVYPNASSSATTPKVSTDSSGRYPSSRAQRRPDTLARANTDRSNNGVGKENRGGNSETYTNPRDVNSSGAFVFLSCAINSVLFQGMVCLLLAFFTPEVSVRGCACVL